jgi:hypothetical protein
MEERDMGAYGPCTLLWTAILPRTFGCMSRLAHGESTDRAAECQGEGMDRAKVVDNMKRLFLLNSGLGCDRFSRAASSNCGMCHEQQHGPEKQHGNFFSSILLYHVSKSNLF